MSVLMTVRCQHQVVIVGRIFGARSIDWSLDRRRIGAIVRSVDRRRIGTIIWSVDCRCIGTISWLVDRMHISTIGCLGCRRNGTVVIGFIPQAYQYGVLSIRVAGVLV